MRAYRHPPPSLSPSLSLVARHMDVDCVLRGANCKRDKGLPRLVYRIAIIRHG